MQLNIPEKWEAFIRAKMQSGAYASADELLDDALHLLQEQDVLEADAGLEALLLEGLNSGPATPMTAKDWDDMAREGQRIAEARKTRKTQ